MNKPSSVPLSRNSNPGLHLSSLHVFFFVCFFVSRIHFLMCRRRTDRLYLHCCMCFAHQQEIHMQLSQILSWQWKHSLQSSHFPTFRYDSLVSKERLWAAEVSALYLTVNCQILSVNMNLSELGCTWSSDDDSGKKKLFTCNVAARDYCISILQEI